MHLSRKGLKCHFRTTLNISHSVLLVTLVYLPKGIKRKYFPSPRPNAHQPPNPNLTPLDATVWGSDDVCTATI